MSFILDALKKSEQKRKLGAIPDLQTEHSVIIPDNRPQRPLWPFWLGAVLLMNILLLGWWLRPWQNQQLQAGIQATQQQATTLPETTAALPGTSSSSPVAQIPLKPSLAPALPASNQQPVPTATVSRETAQPAPPRSLPDANTDEEAFETVSSPTTPARENISAATSSPETGAGPQVQAHGGTPASTAATAHQSATTKSTAPLPALQDLPPAVLQGLPVITIALHYFTDEPAKRFATINGQDLQEGQTVEPGLHLEEITPQGVILRYRGHRFFQKKF